MSLTEDERMVWLIGLACAHSGKPAEEIFDFRNYRFFEASP